jgi:hypothetical protein
MNRYRLVALLGVASFLLACQEEPGSAHSTPQAEAAELKPEADFSSYQGWTKANEDPFKMSPAVSMFCVPNTPQEGNSYSLESPHRDHFLTVYVNPLGEKTFLNNAETEFPIGTTIVKAKLASKDAKMPELLTAMVKREVGYDPEHGDWEFLTVDGAGKKVTSRGKLKNCQSCHDSQKDQGFVFRNYLSSKPAK